MMNRLNKRMSLYLGLVMLAAICSGCGKSTAKSESTQPTVPPTAEMIQNVDSDTAEGNFTQMTEAAETPAQKAQLLYGELLKSYPTILHKDVEILRDLSFGYEDNLAQFGEHYDYFAVLDLNNDGIPELIATTIINNGWMPVSVFQYRAQENELQLLKDPLAPESHATFEHMSTAGGAYSLYICKDNHLHSCWGGDTPIGYQEENHGYVLTQEGLAAVDCEISNRTENASDIAVNFRDILQVNDEEARNSAFTW